MLQSLNQVGLAPSNIVDAPPKPIMMWTDVKEFDDLQEAIAYVTYTFQEEKEVLEEITVNGAEETPQDPSTELKIVKDA